jgi:very-short-patch-repair endonuclease/predicted transcriptional regulator
MNKTRQMLKIEEVVGEDIRDFLFKKYWQENLTTTEIGEMLGVTSGTISSWFKRLGINARDRSQASFVRFSKTSEEERKAITKAANEKVREIIINGEFWLKGGIPGENNQAKQPEARRKNSEYHKKFNPMFNEESARKMRKSMESVMRKRATKHELLFKKALEKLGYFPKFQHAECTSILDFAFVDLKIGIELDGFSHMIHETRREKDIKQDEELEREGWIILRFFNSEIEDHLGECLREVIELVESNKRLLKEAG